MVMICEMLAKKLLFSENNFSLGQTFSQFFLVIGPNEIKTL